MFSNYVCGHTLVHAKPQLDPQDGRRVSGVGGGPRFSTIAVGIENVEKSSKNYDFRHITFDVRWSGAKHRTELSISGH